MRPSIERLRQEERMIEREVRERVVGYLTAALGLVAGLAWNDAIAALIVHWFPIERNSILAKFIYAAAVTVVVVLITTYVVRLLRRTDRVESSARTVTE
ncbi:hypothetical protein HY634_00640 [Candidatus Uhrbacteria bacterium]|nr:hypothetical protein [Candidatus Uhrbacteria bacterium]